MDENNTTIEEIAEKVEKMAETLAQFTPASTLGLPAVEVSAEATARIQKFETCV
jgi:hypothetical protein